MLHAQPWVAYSAADERRVHYQGFDESVARALHNSVGVGLCR
jgi:hypothetical protein